MDLSMIPQKLKAPNALVIAKFLISSRNKEKGLSHIPLP